MSKFLIEYRRQNNVQISNNPYNALALQLNKDKPTIRPIEAKLRNIPDIRTQLTYDGQRCLGSGHFRPVRKGALIDPTIRFLHISDFHVAKAKHLDPFHRQRPIVW